MDFNISLIVATDKKGAIGRNNQLLWHLPNDLKRFKTLTMGKPTIMGRNTFESIGKALPGRDNLILTSDVNYIKKLQDLNHQNNIYIFNNAEQLFEHCKKNYNTNTELMIIGGGEIYKYFFKMANKIYLTLVEEELEADVFFPIIDNKTWQEDKNKRINNYKDDKHKYNYIFMEWFKKL